MLELRTPWKGHFDTSTLRQYMSRVGAYHKSTRTNLTDPYPGQPVPGKSTRTRNGEVNSLPVTWLRVDFSTIIDEHILYYIKIFKIIFIFTDQFK